MEPKLTITKSEIIDAIRNYDFSHNKNKSLVKSIKKITENDILIELVSAKLKLGKIVTNSTAKGSKDKKQDFSVCLTLDSLTNDLCLLVNGNNVTAFSYAYDKGFIDEIKNDQYPYMYDNLNKLGEENANYYFTRYFKKIGLELKELSINSVDFKESANEVTAYAWSIKIKNTVIKNNYIEVGYVIQDKNEEFGQRIFFSK